VILARLGLSGNGESLARLGRKVPRERRERLGLRAHKASEARLGLRDHKERRASAGCQELGVTWGLAGNRAYRARLGHKARAETWGLLGLRDRRASRARSGRRARAETWGPLDLRACRASRDPPGEKGDVGEKGARGLAGTLLLQEGDQFLQRITRNTTKRSYTSVNEQNVTLQTRSVLNKRQRTDQLHFHEGPRATFKTARHEHTHRYAVEAPIFHTSLRSQPRVSVRRSVHLEVYAPVLFQRIRNESRVMRPIFVFADW
jgi:hypothetical protein